MHRVILLMGPTASGKSALAMELAEAIGGEIISVDSAQVYRGMDIGTAKPDAADRQRVPHHLIDLRDPEETFSAADFAALAARRIREISARGRTPLLVGGTMLYFRALLEGLDPMPAVDPAVRAELRARLPEVGAQGLHRELAAVDAAAAARIHPNDPQRILRALEVFLSTGRPLSSFQSGGRRRAPAHWRSLALWPEDRARLRMRINERFDAMLDAGFVQELERLAARPGLTAEHVSQRAVGYRQGWKWLSGQCSLDEFRQRSIDATRQLAKRQLTWLRGQQGIERLCAETVDVGEVLARLAR
ncbi:tRNA delta(2)-isopentenylpyrophosphate transferase [Thioalkalivibrio nitratireducens DSM 14787]|uniref:tRNA dimethylallyltransferase n=1 Tax=Thioalkalivibrio nitratireducens (strain DSM 14787 / UNIQEM 213 / ALEN2) TaxID=1255043 RepID=L0E1C1_THIND|nr:tRNA (adenosine(37)-N6)-dimethylallyltransferase MiaA [Thioalkalivibrio nitratireducens]AGA34416.1 tRNA delta(2)-isopentenylpyrophosphate transferase [Thioalkalivibrio nitratireducens DSM 14787]